jgi:hypothetical protein
MGNLIMIRIILFICFSFGFINPSYSGWFGPDNYDDCVLEKMKGQAMKMIHTAHDACWPKFPDKARSKEISCSNIKCGNLNEAECERLISLKSVNGICFEDVNYKQWLELR